MPDNDMQLSFRYGTVETLMPVAKKTVSRSSTVFSTTISRSSDNH